MSKDSAKTESESLRLPKSPSWIKDPLEGIIGSIYNLGNRDPQQYVPGPTGNDLASFGMGNNIAARYGMAPQASAQPAQPNPNAYNQNRSQAPGRGLFESLGVSAPNATTYNWDAIVGDRPDIQRAYANLGAQQHKDVAEQLGLPDSRVSVSDYGRWLIEQNAPNRPPEYEQRMRELSGFNSPSGKGSDPRIGSNPGVVDMGNGMYGQGGFNQNQMVQPGPATTGGGFNPLSLYGQAASGARSAGLSGPNLADGQSIFDMLLGEGNPEMAAARMGSASLLDGLENYMSPYTQNVVDATLAANREQQARAEAQRAATAAGSGAARGTRNSIYEAQAQMDRERENNLLVSNLNDQAFMRGAGLSIDDANRRQDAARTNAQLRQQANERNALLEQQRLLDSANMMFNENLFNAGQQDTAQNRLLQASGLLSDIGSTYQQNERADIGLLSQLGAQERDIQRQQATSEIALIETIANLLGGLGVDTSQVTGVADSGSSTTRQRPGLLNTIGSVVDLGTGIVDAASGWKEATK